MEGHFQQKMMKRKGIEDVADDFSDFSLSSPATKIRRLDVGLPPIVDEAEPEIPVMPGQSKLQEQSLCSSNESGGLKIEELPNVPENEERAIVLFKPISTTPLSHSASNFSIDPHLFSGLKNQVMSSSQSKSWRLDNDADELAAEDGGSGSGNECQAVVPWIPPRYPHANFPSQIDDNGEMMDAEEMGEATMEAEDSTGIIQQRNGNEGGGGGISSSVGLHQRQQQHCMIPQPPQNMTTPISWYR